MAKLRRYFADNDVRAQVMAGHLLLAWPQSGAPHTLGLRHALDVLGDLLRADIAGDPVRCHAVKDCREKADVLLFLDTPACTKHADVTVAPMVDVEAHPTPWHEVLHRGAPAIMVPQRMVGTLGLAEPPEDAHIRLYWRSKEA